MELKNLRKARETFEKDGKAVEFDAYYMTINGVEIKFKPSKKYVGLVDLLIAQQK